MDHLRKFDSYRKNKKLADAIKENVDVINDTYRVNTLVDIPQSLINAYIKKVKDGLDKNVRQSFSDKQIAEEITKFVLKRGLEIDQIPASALFGGEPQGQPQAQPQIPQGQAQAQPQVQDLPQVQADNVQSQDGAQIQVQPQAQPQGQPQAPQDNPDNFEEVQAQGQDAQVQDNEEEEEDELPM